MLMNKINFEHQNLYNLEIYKFNEDIKKFPNLEDNHISEATYYGFLLIII